MYKKCGELPYKTWAKGWTEKAKQWNTTQAWSEHDAGYKENIKII